MNLFLIPANTKSGKLIFSIFTPFDLILVSSGLTVSVLSFVIFSPNGLGQLVLCLLPGLICALLVMPIPNYHNVYIVIKELIEFFSKRRNYKWEGWRIGDEYK